MSRRILIAELKQETATFNPVRTTYDDFRIYRGTDILSAYRDTRTEVGGVLDVLEAGADFAIVPTLAAAAVSGGPVRTADLERLLDELLARVGAAGPVDAACICLHGAMAGEEENDPEGRLLKRLREVVGNVPLVATLDLHAVLTDLMVDSADILVPYHTYPHVDHRETGQRAARLLVRLLAGTLRPTVARLRLPMLVRGDELLTATGRFGQAIRMCQEVEAAPGGLAAGVIIGNAFTDVPALQSNVIVTMDSDAGAARRHAERIGRFMWENRRLFQANLTPLARAIEEARGTSGLAIFSDAADATASGASGDSNEILKGLLEARFEKKALLAIVDAPAVAAAFKAGVGGRLAVSLGGTRDPGRFTPVRVEVRVKSLHDGDFTYEDGTLAYAGRVAVLVAGSIHILVTERSVFFVGRRVYEQHGLDVRDFALVVVKSPNGFRTFYEHLASRIIPVDVPGSTSANLRSLPYRHCVRPIFPLDEEVPSPLDGVD